MGTLETVLFERSHIFTHVEKRVDALMKGYRQNIGIIGPEGCGKSHLLNRVHRSLSERNDLIKIYLNAESLSFEHFMYRWIGANLSALLQSENMLPSTDVDEMMGRVSEVAPRSVEKIQQVNKMFRKQERSSAVLKELLGLPGIISGEAGKKAVCIIDEFHLMELLPVKDPFAILGREIMVEKETLYLVSSSKAEKAREIFQDKLSMLFGNFEILELAPLNYMETSCYVRKIQPGFSFSETQKKILIHMTDGFPVYIELLLDQLGMSFPVSHVASNEGDKGSEVPNERLVQSYFKELFDSKGRLSLIFEKRLQLCRRFAKDPSPYIQALLAIAFGRRKIPNVATYIDRTVAETKKVLFRLVQEEIVVKRGAFYVIEDHLFRYWLSEVYHKKCQQFEPDETAVKEVFLSSLQRTFERISEEDNRQAVDRIESLFKEFRNDLIEIGGRKWRCPQFQEVTMKPSNSRFSLLWAKNSISRWMCQFATRLVTEEDVLIFKDETKRYRKKLQRRIMIVLAGIDQNAKLLAQEAKIQLWDLRDVNILLDLYGLPKIILMEEMRVNAASVLVEDGMPA